MSQITLGNKMFDWNCFCSNTNKVFDFFTTGARQSIIQMWSSSAYNHGVQSIPKKMDELDNVPQRALKLLLKSCSIDRGASLNHYIWILKKIK